MGDQGFVKGGRKDSADGSLTVVVACHRHVLTQNGSFADPRHAAPNRRSAGAQNRPVKANHHPLRKTSQIAGMIVSKHRDALKGCERLRNTIRRAKRIDLSVIEDGKHRIRDLRRLATEAVCQAAAESRRLGLSRIVIRGEQVFTVNADNEERLIATVKPDIKKYKVGQVWYARKRK